VADFLWNGGNQTVDVDVPTPTPSSMIGVRFVVNGQPVEVLLWSPVSRVIADGIPCPVAVPGIVQYAGGYEMRWPLLPLAGVPSECSKGPPTAIHFDFNSEGTIFGTDVVWAGEDITQDLDVSFLLPPTPTPSPSAVPTPTPGALPSTGGFPRASDAPR
jgi:hypothetical protein